MTGLIDPAVPDVETTRRRGVEDLVLVVGCSGTVRHVTDSTNDRMIVFPIGRTQDHFGGRPSLPTGCASAGPRLHTLRRWRWKTFAVNDHARWLWTTAVSTASEDVPFAASGSQNLLEPRFFDGTATTEVRWGLRIVLWPSLADRAATAEPLAVGPLFPTTTTAVMGTDAGWRFDRPVYRVVGLAAPTIFASPASPMSRGSTTGPEAPATCGDSTSPVVERRSPRIATVRNRASHRRDRHGSFTVADLMAKVYDIEGDALRVHRSRAERRTASPRPNGTSLDPTPGSLEFTPAGG